MRIEQASVLNGESESFACVKWDFSIIRNDEKRSRNQHNSKEERCFRFCSRFYFCAQFAFVRTLEATTLLDKEAAIKERPGKR